MTDPTYTLDLLGPIIVETRDRLRALETRVERIETERLPAIENKLAHHNDEVTGFIGMVLRFFGEPISWSAMQSEIRRLRERIEALEARPKE